MRTNNGYELSDFIVDIFESGDHVKVRVECFADNHTGIPFHVTNSQVIDKDITLDPKFFYAVLSRVTTHVLNEILTSDIVPPDKCECQDREWFRKHPDDRQEYWRSTSGRIYPKAHTVNCPNNPSNQRKKTNG